MEHEIDGMCVIWVCDCCGTQNTDFFNWIAWPECADCQEGFDWGDILPQSEIDEILAAMDPNRFGHLLEIQAA